VIRLGGGQGTWGQLPVRRGRLEVRGTWREVLGVYRDRDALNGAQDPEPGSPLDQLADQAFEERRDAMIIQVCLHELSDPCQAEDLFLIVRQTDLIEVQSLPAPGLENQADPAREFVLAVAQNAIVDEDFTAGNEVFNAVVRDAREVAAGLGLSYEPGEGRRVR